MIIIGIDPGAGGAIVTWNNGLDVIKKCPNSAEKMHDIVSHIMNSSWVDGDGKAVAYLEKVWARPTNAVRAAFHFGENYGRWQGVLATHRIPIIYVLPTKWIKYWENRLEIKLPKEYRDKKKALKEVASNYTDKRVTLINADAILITLYGLHNQQEINDESNN